MLISAHCVLKPLVNELRLIINSVKLKNVIWLPLTKRQGGWQFGSATGI